MTKLKHLTTILLFCFYTTSISAQLYIDYDKLINSYFTESKKGYIHTKEGNAEFLVRVSSDISINTIAGFVLEEGFVVKQITPKLNRLTIYGDVELLNNLLIKDYVIYVEEVLPLVLNGTSTIAAHNAFANYQFDYAGQGIKIGVWEACGITEHIDLLTRYNNKAAIGAGSALAHSLAVAGILAGAGNMDAEHVGMASKSEIFIRNYLGDIALEMDSAVLDDSIVITQNSYSISPTADPCIVRGSYKLISADIDQLAWEYPYLVHVYSAGNGQNDCSANGTTGFRTIPSGYQSAKNVLTVGAIDINNKITDESAWGPVRDGRIKPEVVAMGEGVISISDNNSYISELKGTSYAAPVVSGLAAQLMSKYKTDNGTYPPSSLIRAVICNSARDLGNPGPDFKYGFGKIDALNSFECIRTKNFYIDSIGHQGQNTHDVIVPSGAKELKITIAWTDSAGNPANPGALVNDIDMGLLDPNLAGYLPWVLDTLGNNKTNAAIRGSDHKNNIEQITIKDPAPGTHSVLVVGESISTSTQHYSIAFQVTEQEFGFTYPRGGETWIPGDTQTIWWESNLSGDFRLEYYDGTKWTWIVDGIDSNKRSYDWIIPDTLRGRVNLKLVQGAFNQQLGYISLRPRPENLAIFNCDRIAVLNWEKIQGVSVYDVYMVENGQTRYITSSGGPRLTITGLNNEQEYWFAIRARNSDGTFSRRTQMIKVVPSATKRIKQVSVLDTTRGFCAPITHPVKLNVNYADEYWLQVKYAGDNNWYNLSHNYDSAVVTTGVSARIRVKYVNACGDTVYADTTDYIIEYLNAGFTFERLTYKRYQFTPDYQDPNATYEWRFGDGGFSSEMTPTYEFAFDPEYAGFKVELVIITKYGCTDTSEYQFPIGIDELEPSQISVYPNPAKKFVDIKFDGGTPADYKLSLHNILGAEVNNIEIVKLNNEICRINVATLPKGVYVVKLLINNKVYTKKLVIER